MTRTWGSKFLFVCEIFGADCPDGGAEMAPVPGASGVSQITIFDRSTDSLAATGFFAAWIFAISTLTVTGGSPVWANKAHPQKQMRARITIRRICSLSRTKKYPPGSN